MSPRAKQAIERWERDHEAYATINDFLRAARVPKGSHDAWLSRIPEYKQRFYAALEKHMEGRLEEPSPRRRRAVNRLKKMGDVEPKARAFLEEYRECGDRIAAADKVGLEWEAVEALLSENEEFQAEFEKLRRRQEIKIEDALRRSAAEGDQAALGALVRQGYLSPSGNGSGGGGPAGGSSAPAVPDRDVKAHYRDRLMLLRRRHDARGGGDAGPAAP